jgi:hypothetical protein
LNPFKAVENHSQDHREDDITQNISDEHLACMFGQPN